MSLKNSISKNLILPLSDLITGQSIYKYLLFLEKSQYWSREQIDAYQNEKLRVLIKNAYLNVPFYTELFNDLRLKPEDIHTKKDLIKLPVITKSQIKKAGTATLTSALFPKGKILTASSSGSTGEPLFYLNTKDAYSMNLAANLRGWYWMGFKLGDKYIKLSQNPRNNPLKRLQDKMSNNLYLATNPLTEENFDFILKQIEQYQPKVVRCYPDPLLLLARYKQKHSEFTYRPLAVTTTGNTLYPETRTEIENAFGCKVFDAYSCEGNSTVFECPTHSCYHSTEEYGISEIIDETGKPINQGIGRLITTDLWNLAHPFIRYDTQDYVEIDSSPCICGRQHLKILRILGRDNEILDQGDRGIFIVHDFTIFFSRQDLPTFGKIDQFQVVKKDSKVIFKLKVNDDYNPTISSYIKNYWEKEMLCPVSVEIVNEIPLTNSGKRRFIINERGD